LSSTNLITREKSLSHHQRRAHHRQNDPSKEMGEEFMNFEKEEFPRNNNKSQRRKENAN